jgi:hypothetical protein
MVPMFNIKVYKAANGWVIVNNEGSKDGNDVFVVGENEKLAEILAVALTSQKMTGMQTNTLIVNPSGYPSADELKRMVAAAQNQMQAKVQNQMQNMASIAANPYVQTSALPKELWNFVDKDTQ